MATRRALALFPGRAPYPVMRSSVCVGRAALCVGEIVRWSVCIYSFHCPARPGDAVTPTSSRSLTTVGFLEVL